MHCTIICTSLYFFFQLLLVFYSLSLYLYTVYLILWNYYFFTMYSILSILDTPGGQVFDATWFPPFIIQYNKTRFKIILPYRSSIISFWIIKQRALCLTPLSLQPWFSFCQFAWGVFLPPVSNHRNLSVLSKYLLHESIFCQSWMLISDWK